MRTPSERTANPRLPVTFIHISAELRELIASFLILRPAFNLLRTPDGSLREAILRPLADLRIRLC